MSAGKRRSSTMVCMGVKCGNLPSPAQPRAEPLLREDNVRGSVRRNMLDCPISQRAEIQAAKERFPLAKRNWSNSEVNFIHVAGLNVLPHCLDTTANLNVLCACCFARLLQRIFNAVRDKM